MLRIIGIFGSRLEIVSTHFFGEILPFGTTRISLAFVAFPSRIVWLPQLHEGEKTPRAFDSRRE